MEKQSSSEHEEVKLEPDEENSSPSKFQVNMGLIQSASLGEEEDDLKSLNIGVFNQEDLEQGLMQQVDDAISKEEEKKKKEALKKEMKKINDEIRALKHDLASLATQMAQLGYGKVSTGGANRRLISAQKQKEIKLVQVKDLEERKKNIQARIDGKLPLFDEQEQGLKNVLDSTGNEDRDRMIKSGEMTPFGTVINSQDNFTARQTGSIKAEPTDDSVPGGHSSSNTTSTIHTTHIPEEQAESEGEIHTDGEEWLPSNRDGAESESDEPSPSIKEESKKGHIKSQKKSGKGWSKKFNRPIYCSHSDDSDTDDAKAPRAKAIRKYRDDGNEDYFLERMEKLNERELSKQRLREAGRLSDSEDDEEFDGGMKVPGRIWSKLYKYQKTCVKWLWELHCQQAGGIVGDEMGLGKTIQTIAFLAGLKYSRLRNNNFSYIGLGPTIIVCPATVMHQWVKEFHSWWPTFRVAVLHSSGTYVGKEKELIRQIVRSNGILVTSYSTLVLQQEHLLAYNWHYIVLDEGHKIRNPDVKATLVCKQFRTPHRIILSGSPIQNNLRELWSLMDFVFPGKLGTLPDFMQHFAVPIVQGGYSNATDVQVKTAYKCACVLRDTINPYLLRRMKADVKSAVNLPAKNEQVLFCRLSKDQREVYEEYLASRECQEIMRGRLMVFSGLIQLRKICNHADLATGGPRVFQGSNFDENDPTMEYGHWKRAGKMIVVDALLKLWKKQGHKVLLFTQSKQMLDIIEKYVQEKRYTYVRMDGGTGISSRQPLVQRYNTDDSIYLFLLTTRVGGLGINLVGANRIIIYDPDWNPSTDMQARERSWRIGQKRQVTIYRLLTTGTIEEKIYHRQIFKQFLTNRVLKDPKQRRLFKTNDLYELFSLGLSDDKGETETAALFAGTGSDVGVKVPAKEKNVFDRIKEEKVAEEQEDEEEDKRSRLGDGEVVFSKEEVQKMRAMARKLSRKIEQEKVQRLLREAEEAKQGSSNLGMDCNESQTDSSKSTSERSHSEVNSDVNKASPAEDKQNSYGTITADISKLKHFKIKKKPSSTSVDTMNEKLKQTSKSSDIVPDMVEKGKTLKRKSSSEHEETKLKHKKKKKHKKDARFEGERIPNLVKVRDYKRSKVPEDVDAEKDQQEHEAMDNYVLQKLFKKTDIQGALKHDTIMEPGKPDYVIVEAEAEKVAKEASSALKRSRSQCLPATSGVPTWTGHHGGKRPRFGQKKNNILNGATDPKEKPDNKEKQATTKQHFDGSLAGSVQTNIVTGTNMAESVSSTDLLNKMRVRNEVYTKTGEGEEEENDGEDVFVSDPNSFELVKRLREFIMFECTRFGQATTKELIQEFGSKLPPENSAKFRALLHSICDFDRPAGVWKLRPDFK